MGDEDCAGIRDVRKIFSFHRVIRSRRSRMRGSSAPRLTFIRYSVTPGQFAASRLDDFESVIFEKFRQILFIIIDKIL